MSPFVVIVAATAALCVAFSLVYLLARRIDNYGIVDIAWSYAFALLAGAYALLLNGDLTRRLILAFVVIAWSTRLGTHLGRRVMQHHPVEDARYLQLRRDWAANFDGRMFGFFQLQAVSIVVLATPWLFAMQNSAAFPRPLEVGGFALLLLALAGESIADRQLAVFKRVPANRTRVCDVGLWRYSRHPNYFFEWLIWVGFFAIASAAPWGWLGIISPAAMLYLLLRVTGIPLTEAQSLRTRGDAYRRYQETTSAFLPWLPRKR